MSILFLVPYWRNWGEPYFWTKHISKTVVDKACHWSTQNRHRLCMSVEATFHFCSPKVCTSVFECVKRQREELKWPPSIQDLPTAKKWGAVLYPEERKKGTEKIWNLFSNVVQPTPFSFDPVPITQSPNFTPQKGVLGERKLNAATFHFVTRCTLK